MGTAGGGGGRHQMGTAGGVGEEGIKWGLQRGGGGRHQMGTARGQWKCILQIVHLPLLECTIMPPKGVPLCLPRAYHYTSQVKLH